MHEPTREIFMKDVASHAMTIALDSGVYRHLRFRRPQNNIHWFDIVTWPGNLCVRGDMGTWTFSRVDDMFTFFRGDRINPTYWAEKLQAGNSGPELARRFSIDELRRRTRDSLENFGDELSDEKRKAVMRALEQDVFERFGDSEEYPALAALFDFKLHGVTFDPCDGPYGKTWSYHYIWCLHAIVWGISQYDKKRLSDAGGGINAE